MEWNGMGRKGRFFGSRGYLLELGLVRALIQSVSMSEKSTGTQEEGGK